VSLRIAQVAPLFESVPPRHYGGTERVVSYLTEALVDAGHRVTLFASGDSVTRAELVAIVPTALRLDERVHDLVTPHVVMLEKVAQAADAFDIIHSHCDCVHLPALRRVSVPHVTTVHNRLDTPDLQAVLREFADFPLVSISDSQREPVPGATWVGTVHHGIPLALHRASLEPGGYFAFVGRISPDKRPDRAIQIAKRLHTPLKIAARVTDRRRPYFEQEIRPLLDDPLIEFLGEVDEVGKGELLRGASALLFPIDWPEPFGLVMIEAMACGTPVVAFRHGSAPEVIEEGVTGFTVSDLSEAVDAAQRAAHLDRRRVREAFERRFSAERMARDYVGVYERVLRTAGRLACAATGRNG